MTTNDAAAATREKVIRAATACILDEGFYRASSNEIARRAEVSWGVIQYHFGSREALLLAVLDHAVEQLRRLVDDAVIDGDTLEERIDSFADVVWSYYGQKEFLAYVQVMLNLSHDPTTAQQTRKAVTANSVQMGQALPKLLDDALGVDLVDGHPEAADVRTFVFAALRGLAIDQEHQKAVPRPTRPPADGFGEQRRRMVEALAGYVRQVASSQGTRSRPSRPKAKKR